MSNLNPAEATVDQHAQVTNTLNRYRAERLADMPRNPWQPSNVWWESLGAMTFRLKDYKTLAVVGSIRRVTGFHGFRWEARVNEYGYTREFDSGYKAAAWVEEYNPVEYSVHCEHCGLSSAEMRAIRTVGLDLGAGGFAQDPDGICCETIIEDEVPHV